MKPIKLTIDGINSYAKKQDIDFQELTSRGLFAIFGKTGSGKSTILDAMTLALYGNIARGSKEFINTNCNKASVEYTFEISNGIEKIRYIVYRRFKKKISLDKVSSVSDSVRLTKIDKEGSSIIADKVSDVNSAIKDIIGLEEGDFLKSVVLPQGKFSEFLVLSGKDRRNMLERLFNLEEYGSQLNKKIFNRRSELQRESEVLEARISEYGDININIKKELEEQILALDKKEKLLNKEIEISSARFEKMNLVYNLNQDKKNNEDKLTDLLNQAPYISELIKKVNAYDYVQNLIENKLKYKNYNKEELEYKERILTIDKKRIELKKKIDKSHKQYSKIEDEIKRITIDKEFRDKLISMEIIANQRQDLYEEIEIHNAEKENDEEKIKEIDLNIEKIVQKKIKLEGELHTTKSDMEFLEKMPSKNQEDLDTMYFELNEIKNKKLYLVELEDSIRDINSKILYIQNKNEKLEFEKEKLMDRIDKISFELKSLEEESSKMDIDILANKIKEILIETKRTHGICPVCNNKYIDLEIDKSILDENKISQRLDHIRQGIEDEKRSKDSIESEIKYNQKAIEEKLNQKEENINKINKILSRFINHKIVDITEFRENILSILDKNIIEREALYKEYREFKHQREEKLKTLEKIKISEEKNVYELKSSIEVQKNNKDNFEEAILKTKKLIFLKNEKIKEIEEKINKFSEKNKIENLKEEIERVKEFDKIVKELNIQKESLFKEIKELISIKDDLDISYNEINIAIEKISTSKMYLNETMDLNKLKIENVYPDFDFNLIDILIIESENSHKKVSYIKEDEYIQYKNKIQIHEKSLIEVKNNIKLLNSKLYSIEFEEKDIEKNIVNQEKNKLDKINKEYEDLKIEKSTCKYRLNELIDRLKQLEAIISIFEKNKKELDNINVLEKLMRGNRFVEYLSQIYLKNIVFDASARLENITNGRFSLEINSDYTFMVRDNFNGGNRRSADTLSGGETFLTSLSLALALSTQIQLKGNAPLEFFFLDEGFGTLDRELLDTVINSLEKLHSDTMSVGIISHVEELKNRIPIKLIVELDEIISSSIVNIELS
ncbi:AAA family ATPase [Peptostreptococcus equinus]|uniref:Nuclease SbcCD subunit C n=1 Tax=Peptostreptococcus equinus TaxID=3003601 RepID=A0ABY7JMK7_9FIRM|nr:SMC family ATPase [Peptostreptococcus sp. CBA3647]WAW14330.1 SMC family ATPase [Peptostreptococcus sp. CBA3647]